MIRKEINGFVEKLVIFFSDQYNGRGILLYIREDIPSKLLSIERNLTEASFVEINLRNKKKWLISCSYNPKRASIANHLSTLSKCTDIYTAKYGNLIFLGDFNAGVEDTDIKIFVVVTTSLVW